MSLDTSQEITSLLQAIDGAASNWVNDDELYRAIDQLLLAVKWARRMDESATLVALTQARRSLLIHLGKPELTP
jgi:hypothetical protein